MALHTAMQVFRPEPSVLGQGGLYSFRMLIYAFLACFPGCLCALAFTSDPGYMSQGPTCSLPIRPFWHRLAISWIPRYVIMITIVILYISIYVHAERQLTNTDSFRGWMNMKINAVREGDHQRATTTDPSTVSQLLFHTTTGPSDLYRSPANQVIRGSHGDTTPASYQVASQVSNPEGVQGSLTGRASVGGNLHLQQHQEQQRPNVRQSVGFEGRLRRPTTRDPVQEQMQRKHDAIRRQLRMLFIYPLCYFIVWIMPFVNHLQTYNNYRAENPIFALVVLSYISISLIGTVDSIVFSVRERPWRHISGTDGTILGSFQFWKHGASRKSSMGSIAPNNTRNHEGSHCRIEVEDGQVAGVLSGAQKNEMAEQKLGQGQGQNPNQLRRLTVDAGIPSKESVARQRGSV